MRIVRNGEGATGYHAGRLMTTSTTIASAIAAIIFACIIATAVIPLWKAPLRDPDAPLAKRTKKKKRQGPQNHAAPAPPPGGPRPRIVTSQTRRGRRLLRRDPRSALLPPDATVTFADERRDANIDEVFTALDNDLVGLFPIKKKVQEIAALLLVDRARKRFGLEAPRPNMHMCFTGPPGTGKTTVALRMADLLHRLGYLEEGHLVHAMRDDLVGQYVGQTAPRTKRVLEKAMGGVLFIDEAYYLYRAGDSLDYGQEVIDILLQVMENEREQLVVILAGYKDRMDEFFGVNPGMSSRIAHHLDFAAYELDELAAIGQLMLEGSRYHLSEAAEQAFRNYLVQRMQQPRFANARSVRNELERARLRHAHRLASDLHRHWTRDDLMRLEPEDIFVSDPELLLEQFQS